ncbi:tyrosine-tRNA ligase [Anaeramoeba flamelloides]|uniref:tyrosine--tRNA ligase n=1 Tax=Anaeramoeba flamelloides TaxID=1746091 RepID=A0ABQ8X2V3_9EUKA|nr:tyrosine-tRNA ligase [Anaeramoeba flamelloides]
MTEETKTEKQTEEKKELSLQEKYELCLSIGEECIKPTELYSLLEHVEQPLAYDGFEPSGRMHIAQGILKVINVNKLTQAGCKFVFWVADWFALMNNKMGGDLKKIKLVGQYMIEVWKACGMDMTNVEFLWSSDEINKRSNEYWTLVLDIARRNSVKRIQRCGQIMGRNNSDDLYASQIFYPCMQAADIFFLKANICQLGIDQRKVNMLAREYCDLKKIRHKPVIISHHMIMGLKKGQAKMSKSDPDSAIFMEDLPGDVNRKINGAYCPEGDVEKNPIFDYLKYIIFQKVDSITITRKEEWGGNVTYNSYEEVEQAFIKKELHPQDLKKAVAKVINQLIDPVRQYFKNNKKAKRLLAQVKKAVLQEQKRKQKEKLKNQKEQEKEQVKEKEPENEKEKK